MKNEQTVIRRLTTVQTYRPTGVLVSVNGQPQVITPDTNPVTKNGRKQFYAYLNHVPTLIVQTAQGWVAQTSNQNKRRT